MAGYKSKSHWKSAIKFCSDTHVERGVGIFLRDAGNRWGKSVIGRDLEILWPGDNQYYNGKVMGFDEASGTHQVKCDAYTNNTEWVYLFLQTTKWAWDVHSGWGTSNPRAVNCVTKQL
eukprot:CAMPEP_0198705804 /NCGR_PEP_ID=MMETSP1468-20131203/390613_1 /TAXON_ID=1461545 /ORGANISM="Mantoniella sp, Strain CCMP1436" /LENGTH=117 /DNA_ID=CAMNT_0044464691 /DNA_START=1316 /DNA_END=1669 /DNA_ORIENTATION=+